MRYGLVLFFYFLFYGLDKELNEKLKDLEEHAKILSKCHKELLKVLCFLTEDLHQMYTDT